MDQFGGLFWLAVTLLPLAFLQRLLHREIQSVFLILSRSREVSIALFSLIFFPGVLLHEFSHYVTALILGVHAPGFSMIPRVLPDGRLQLGYVETEKTDVVRDSLIGVAPLVTGALAVAYIALTRLELLPLWEALHGGHLAAFWASLRLLPQAPDFPLWFYLLFTVSSTMLPSQSDRHAWLPVATAILVLLALAWSAGAAPWMLSNFAPPLNQFLSAVAVIFGLSAVVHGAIILFVGALHLVLARLSGTDVAQA